MQNSPKTKLKLVAIVSAISFALITNSINAKTQNPANTNPVSTDGSIVRDASEKTGTYSIRGNYYGRIESMKKSEGKFVLAIGEDKINIKFNPNNDELSSKLLKAARGKKPAAIKYFKHDVIGDVANRTLPNSFAMVNNPLTNSNSYDFGITTEAIDVTDITAFTKTESYKQFKNAPIQDGDLTKSSAYFMIGSVVKVARHADGYLPISYNRLCRIMVNSQPTEERGPVPFYFSTDKESMCKYAEDAASSGSDVLIKYDQTALPFFMQHPAIYSIQTANTPITAVAKTNDGQDVSFSIIAKEAPYNMLLVSIYSVLKEIATDFTYSLFPDLVGSSYSYVKSVLQFGTNYVASFFDEPDLIEALLEDINEQEQENVPPKVTPVNKPVNNKDSKKTNTDKKPKIKNIETRTVPILHFPKASVYD